MASISFIQFVSMLSMSVLRSRFTSASRAAGSAPFLARSSIDFSVSRSFSEELLLAEGEVDEGHLQRAGHLRPLQEHLRGRHGLVDLPEEAGRGPAPPSLSTGL